MKIERNTLYLQIFITQSSYCTFFLIKLLEKFQRNAKAPLQNNQSSSTNRVPTHPLLMRPLDEDRK